MLWACLHFPALALEGPGLAANTETPIAAVQRQGAQASLIAVNAAAAAFGVRTGHSPRQATALTPQLQLLEHDPDAQRARLEQLGFAALRHSSWVALEAPDALLLEIASSLRLFGGLDALIRRLHEDTADLGLQYRLGVAPVPAAAVLFARAGIDDVVTRLNHLPAVLDPIPLQALGLDTFSQRGLRQSGLRTLGQVLALPREALNKRFGHELGDRLLRINGTLPERPTALTLPEQFDIDIELPQECTHAPALGFALKRLLQALEGFLRARDLGAAYLRLDLSHADIEPTMVGLELLESNTRSERLAELFALQFERIDLPAPVRALRLRAEDFRAREHHSAGDLLQSRRTTRHESDAELSERLRLRFGADTVYRLASADDHRPERAWRREYAGGRRQPASWPARPLWLYETPRQVHEPLQLLSPAERIENGWWDQIDVRRDYFIARREDGSCLWVYRQRRDGRFFAHGLFS